MECVFCRIGEKEIPSDIVYEDDYVLAALDIHPIAPGHTIVIPKNHLSVITDFSDEDIGPFFRDVKRVTMILEKALSPHGFTIGINHGEKAGQAIPHFHLHIVPRWEDDGGGSIHSVVRNVPRESLSDIFQKIRAVKVDIL